MATSSDLCSLHRSHSPANLTVEFHHVLPQAWQRFWVPAGVTPKGALKLWDARTVPICPTGHRNVHALIVLLTKQLTVQGDEDVSAAVKACGLQYVRHKPTGTTALLALERFTAAGGKLLELTAAGEWGEA